jgi:superfamily II RNA helicase
LAKETQVLTLKLDAVKNRLWHAFQKHLGFLKETNFATEDSQLTPDGMWASQLRLDQPLMIAEAIRHGLFESLSPQLLAGTIAPFVNDKPREVELNSEVSLDRRPIKGACRVIRQSLQPLWQLKKARGFESPPFQFWPAAAIYAWAMGMEWEEVIRFVSADDGDMAMLIYRTADNLRQIASLEKTHPGLASKAKQAVSLLFREPILIVR